MAEYTNSACYYKIKKKQPWYKSYIDAKSRCENIKNSNYKYYGAKNIKFLISFGDYGFLYKRDGAYRMVCPTIDRINPSGNYEFFNCRFIERSENTRRSKLGKHLTPEHKHKISIKRIGKKHTRQTLKKISDSLIGRTPWNKGIGERAKFIKVGENEFIEKE